MGIMREKSNNRRHLGSVINYLSELNARVTTVDTEQNEYAPTCLGLALSYQVGWRGRDK